MGNIEKHSDKLIEEGLLDNLIVLTNYDSSHTELHKTATQAAASPSADSSTSSTAAATASASSTSTSTSSSSSSSTAIPAPPPEPDKTWRMNKTLLMGLKAAKKTREFAAKALKSEVDVGYGINFPALSSTGRQLFTIVCRPHPVRAPRARSKE